MSLFCFSQSRRSLRSVHVIEDFFFFFFGFLRRSSRVRAEGSVHVITQRKYETLVSIQSFVREQVDLIRQKVQRLMAALANYFAM